MYGAQSAQVLLDAIAASDGSREDIIAKMFETNVQEGILGTFSFSADGDPVGEGGATTAIVIYRATDKLETETTINPKQETVDAALGN
jgi:hypothetical protein